MKIYTSYDDEPETPFDPVTEALYADLYEIEMDDQELDEEEVEDVPYCRP